MTLMYNSTCPFCGKVSELASGITKAGEVTKEPTPENGDATLCVSCGEWSIVDDTRSDNLRKPTSSEYENIANNKICTAAREAWVRAKNRPITETVKPKTQRIEAAFEEMFAKVYGERFNVPAVKREMRRTFYGAVYETVRMLVAAHEDRESDTIFMGTLVDELIVELNDHRKRIINGEV